MNCDKCDTINSSWALFCKKCGFKITHSAVAVHRSGKKKIININTDESRSNRGKQSKNDQAVIMNGVGLKSRSNERDMVFVTAIIVLLTIAVVGALYFFPTQTPDNIHNQQQTIVLDFPQLELEQPEENKKEDPPATVICTSFQYTDWSECSTSGTQARTIIKALPSGCIGGLPIQNRSCASRTPTIEKPPEQEPPPKNTEIDPLKEIALRAAGPEIFAIHVMGMSIEELRRLFPGFADKDLPQGAILSTQIYDLSDIIKKETRLKEWEEAAKQQIKSGKTLIPDTEEYIRKRDETISGIDKMLDDTRNNIGKTSDPQERGKMVDYINFLGVLRGRQNQSYTAFLNQNIDAYNKESDRVTEQYNKARDLYNEEFQSRSKAITEHYNRWKSILRDVWQEAH